MNGQRLKHDCYLVYLGVTFDLTLSYREHLSLSAAKLNSRNYLTWNSMVLHGVPAQAPFAHQPWLYQSQNTAVQCGLDPATQISSTPNFIVNAPDFRLPATHTALMAASAQQCCTYVVKRQVTICYKSSKPIQIGLCMLMSLSIDLHGLHLNAQYGQTWHLSTQLRSGSPLVIGWCGQPHYCYRPYYLTARFRSPSTYMVSDEPYRTGQGPCHVNLHKWAFAQSPSCDLDQR